MIFGMLFNAGKLDTWVLWDPIGFGNQHQVATR